jgi:hypothetical protein
MNFISPNICFVPFWSATDHLVMGCVTKYTFYLFFLSGGDTVGLFIHSLPLTSFFQARNFQYCQIEVVRGGNSVCFVNLFNFEVVSKQRDKLREKILVSQNKPKQNQNISICLVPFRHKKHILKET